MSLPNVCPFCDKTQSFRYIAETQYIRAIYPRNPAVTYHILLTPKRHIKLLDDFNSQEEQDLFLLLKKITKTAEQELGNDYLGFNILSNNGSEQINQRVAHAHVHIFLRTKLDVSNPLEAKHSSASLQFTQKQLEYMNKIQSWFKD